MIKRSPIHSVGKDSDIYPYTPFLPEMSYGIGAEVLDDPTLVDAAEWDDSDGNVTHSNVAGTVTWDGAGDGNIISTDAPFTADLLYRIEVVIDSISAGSIKVPDSAGAFQGTNPSWSSAGSYILHAACSADLQFYLYGSAACDAVVSGISVKRLF